MAHYWISGLIAVLALTATAPIWAQDEEIEEAAAEVAGAVADEMEAASDEGPEHPLALMLISRWLHIFAAVAAAGGAFFTWIVLLPAAGKTLEGEALESFRSAVIGRWKFVVHVCVLLLIVTGFYNFFVRMSEIPSGSPYHMLFGIKFMLALIVFGLAIALASEKRWSEALRAKRKFWTGVLVACAAGVIAIGGYLKFLPL